MKLGIVSSGVCAVAIAILATWALRVDAQSGADLSSQNGAGAPSSDSGIASQPGAPHSLPPGIEGQPGNDSTLEISPQPGMRPPSGDVGNVPSNREFRPGQDEASIQPRGLSGNGGQGNGVKPYLGMTIKYTTECFIGGEEHGLEVISLDPNSPAEKAGLKPASSTVAQGVLGVVGAALGPISVLTNHFADRTAMMARGDLIVAVDDHRIRSQADIDDELARLRPGDTMYLTVLRPTVDGHRTLRVAVKVGQTGEYAQAAPGAAAAPPGTAPATY